jgi:hypothetical protein
MTANALVNFGIAVANSDRRTPDDPPFPERYFLASMMVAKVEVPRQHYPVSQVRAE